VRAGLLTALALVAFAANSLLCRAALDRTAIDPATFTGVRLVSGAIALAILVAVQRGRTHRGTWRGALALFVYAAAFSFAYVGLSTGTGALLLFGAVQLTMVAGGFRAGERLAARPLAGLLLAMTGLVVLVVPGLTAPPAGRAGLMLVAGAAWGAYSLHGRGSGDPLGATAGNFLRTLPFAALLWLPFLGRFSIDAGGFGLAVASGAVASGAGYAVWYAALPSLRAASAGVVQLAVPVLAALAGVVILGEAVTLRLAVAGFTILGGIALVLLGGRRRS
jgi:drug/metabolite transporter (DMT)-like permease